MINKNEATLALIFAKNMLIDISPNFVYWSAICITIKKDLNSLKK